MMPIMTMVFNVVGLIGAYLYSIISSTSTSGSSSSTYQFWTDPKDYIIGVIKAAVFGVALSLAACYQGFNVRGGAKEVGLATTRAVVAGSVSVLVLDYFLIDIFHILWPFKVVTAARCSTADGAMPSAARPALADPRPRPAQDLRRRTTSCAASTSTSSAARSTSSSAARGRASRC